MATFVEVHVTRAHSLPKIKARFHILMLVSCLCDQNDQLSFLGVEVHVTRASSLPKIKARFHIFMLVSCLCDQNDQLSFLGVEVHLTRASSLPKIKARFHIFMLVSWLCDQKWVDIHHSHHNNIIIIFYVYCHYQYPLSVHLSFPLYTRNIERGPGDRRSWTVITEVSMTTGIHNIIYI